MGDGSLNMRQVSSGGLHGWVEREGAAWDPWEVTADEQMPGRVLPFGGKTGLHFPKGTQEADFLRFPPPLSMGIGDVRQSL